MPHSSIWNSGSLRTGWQDVPPDVPDVFKVRYFVSYTRGWGKMMNFDSHVEVWYTFERYAFEIPPTMPNRYGTVHTTQNVEISPTRCVVFPPAAAPRAENADFGEVIAMSAFPIKNSSTTAFCATRGESGRR